jgi:hypothetical protein
MGPENSRSPRLRTGQHRAVPLATIDLQQFIIIGNKIFERFQGDRGCFSNMTMEDYPHASNIS